MLALPRGQSPLNPTVTIVQNNFWIGHSHWGDWDAMADYNELRVWSAALSERQLRINNAMGPDVVPAKGALDLTGAKLEIPNFAPHGGAILFARSTDGRITGKPDVSEWKKRGYDIRISADGTEAKLFRVGMTLYVR